MQYPHMGNKIFLAATVKRETFKKLEQMRGMIPRSRIVEEALLQYLERETSGQKT
jgi:hypothetical protein